VAVSTDGQSPAFAAWLAKLLDDLLDRYLGRVLARYARLRPKMKARYPRMTDRAQAWQRMLDEEEPRVLAAGRSVEAVSGRQKAESSRQEAVDRRQSAGGIKQEAGGSRQGKASFVICH
jgi:uroporphyrin-III C-methyltransferase/precorrin-2 dehydrogenase/sirohydrochlorin ferrochelatase